MALPLSDPVPLRTTAVWPAFGQPEPLPVVYGLCRVGAVRYTADRKTWLLADHAIGGVDSVAIDGKPYQAYAWRNAVDVTGHAVALLELAAALADSAELSVAIRGRLNPATGALLENPAEVYQDILRLAGYSVADASIADFRSECASLQVAGVLSAGLTLRAQIAELADSVGMIWSPAMRGFAKRWPQTSKPAGEPLYANYAAADLAEVSASCRHDDLYTGLRVEYDWDWARDSARRSLTLRADSYATYGLRETTLQAKWLTAAAAATARGTAWLRERARPRWTLTLETDLEPAVPPGGWFEVVSHPLLPATGNLLALDAQWDWSNQRQTLTARANAGTVPTITTTGAGELFDEPTKELSVVYADGIATLTVVDSDGRPIRDAVVTFDAQKGKTNKSGVTRFKTDRGVHLVTVEATGYQTSTAEITL